MAALEKLRERPLIKMVILGRRDPAPRFGDAFEFLAAAAQDFEHPAVGGNDRLRGEVPDRDPHDR